MKRYSNSNDTSLSELSDSGSRSITDPIFYKLTDEEKDRITEFRVLIYMT